MGNIKEGIRFNYVFSHRIIKIINLLNPPLVEVHNFPFIVLCICLLVFFVQVYPFGPEIICWGNH